MAATKHDETKDKPKPWQYAQEIEPDEEVIKMYCEQMLDCRSYRTEYKECKSLKGKVNQYFVYGQTLDCTYLKDAYESCEDYMKSGNEEAKEYMITYEMAKRDYRMSHARANDVWEYRTAPYREWDDPVQMVKQEEIKEEDIFIPARQNMNLNNANNNKDSETDQKGGNSKADISKQVSELSAGDASNNKGMCVIS